MTCISACVSKQMSTPYSKVCVVVYTKIRKVNPVRLSSWNPLEISKYGNIILLRDSLGAFHGVRTHARKALTY